MRKFIPAIALAALMATGLSAQAEAKGCIRGAAAGAVVGHMAGHHAVMGAVGGCLVARAHYRHQAEQRGREHDMHHRY